MAKEQLPLFGFSGSIQSSVPAEVAFPSSMIGIFREAIKIPARNGSFMLQVMLLILSPFSLVVLLHYLLAGPLVQKVEDGYENSTLDPKDVRALVGAELFFFAAFCVVSFFGMMLITYASASTYIGKHIGMKDLVLLIRSTWKKPLVTWLHVSFLTVIYVLLLVVTVKVVNVIGFDANAAYVWSWVVGILAAVFYLYLAARWTLALVVSVVEDGIYGAKALGRVQKLIRGRNIQGFFLIFILLLLSIPIYVLFYVTATDDDDELGPFTQFAFGTTATILFCIAKFFIFVVFTVFYYECKQSNGERVEEEFGPGYSLVPHRIQVDPSVF